MQGGGVGGVGGGGIKSGLLQEKHLSDGTVSVLLVSGGEVVFFIYFFLIVHSEVRLLYSPLVERSLMKRVAEKI